MVCDPSAIMGWSTLAHWRGSRLLVPVATSIFLIGGLLPFVVNGEEVSAATGESVGKLGVGVQQMSTLEESLLERKKEGEGVETLSTLEKALLHIALRT